MACFEVYLRLFYVTVKNQGKWVKHFIENMVEVRISSNFIIISLYPILFSVPIRLKSNAVMSLSEELKCRTDHHGED